MKSDLDRRVQELEIQLAHLQRLFDQLNEVVTQQSLVIDRTGRTVAMLQQRISELKEKASEPMRDPLDEKPPHY